MILTDTMVPLDSKTLADYMHSFGVNIRYLGKIFAFLEKKPIPFLKILIERVIFVRALKHVFRELFTKIPRDLYSEMTAQVLNCIFYQELPLSVNNNHQAPIEIGKPIQTEGEQKVSKKNKKKKVNKDEQGEDNIESSQQETKKEVSNQEIEEVKKDIEGGEKSKKKKKKSIKKNKDKIELTYPTTNFGQLKIENEEDQISKITISVIWERTRVIARKRYQHELPVSIKDFVPLQYPLTRLAIFRDISLSNGIVLKGHSFNISSDRSVTKIQKDSKSSAFPFSSDDIIDFVPFVKHLEPSSNEVKNQIDIVIFDS